MTAITPFLNHSHLFQSRTITPISATIAKTISVIGFIAITVFNTPCAIAIAFVTNAQDFINVTIVLIFWPMAINFPIIRITGPIDASINPIFTTKFFCDVLKLLNHLAISVNLSTTFVNTGNNPVVNSPTAELNSSFNVLIFPSVVWLALSIAP